MHLTYETVDRGDCSLGEVMLRRYATDDGETGYEILVNGNFLMATHGHHSESAMAALALGEWGRAGASVMVGGLGAGYTLRAALDQSGTAEVVVVEIAEKIVEWNRLYFAADNGSALDDPRVSVVVENAADHLRGAHGRYDVILMDADNGPGWLAAPGNERLYADEGVVSMAEALRPGGVLAVWSPSPNPAFEESMRAGFSGVRRVDTTAIGKRVGEPGDVVYLGRKP